MNWFLAKCAKQGHNAPLEDISIMTLSAEVSKRVKYPHGDARFARES
jgi:hypothetical protein